MTLPVDSASLNPAVVAAADHVAWHNEIDTLLPALGLPTVTTASTGHLAHHQLVHESLEMGLPFTLAENASYHLPDHHRLLHLYLTRGPQTISQPGGSQTVSPGSDPATAITAAGNNGTVWFASGTHRIASYANLRPRSGQTWVGAVDAIITGAVVISGPWTVSGSTWWATGQLPGSANTTGVCQGGGTDCQPCEDVYRDGAHLTRVMSQGAVGPGKYFNDYATNRIYVGDDPAGHVIEQAKKANFIHANDAINPNVTLRNLTVQQFACPFQDAAVIVGNGAGTGWLVEQCLIKLNHADGVKTYGNNTTVRRCVITQNGSVGGPHGYQAANLVAEGNEVSGNNNNNFDPGWEAGGAKPVHVDDPVYRGNVFKDNLGTGLWFDIDTRRGLVRWNGLVRNRTGIHYEISFDGTIEDNYCADNTTEQIQWNASARGTVKRNRLIVPDVANSHGLRFDADPNRDTTDPSDYEPHTFADVDCWDNEVTMRGPLGLYANSVYLLSGAGVGYLNELDAKRNTYRLAYRTDPDAFWLNQTRSFTQWQAAEVAGAGKDSDGTLAGPVARNTAEGGSNGTTVTLANSGGSSGLGLNPTVPAGGTLIFDNTRAANGSLSYKLATAGTAGSVRLTWTTGVGTLSGTLYLRLYLYWTANPASPVRLINLLQGGATQASGLTLTTAGLLQGIDAASNGTVLTSTAIALNQWVRVEMKVVLSTTVGQHEIKLFNTATSTTPTETQTSGTNLVLTSDVDTYRIGSVTSLANLGPFWMDDLAISQEGYVGV